MIGSNASEENINYHSHFTDNGMQTQRGKYLSNTSVTTMSQTQQIELRTNSKFKFSIPLHSAVRELQTK